MNAKTFFIIIVVRSIFDYILYTYFHWQPSHMYMRTFHAYVNRIALSWINTLYAVKTQSNEQTKHEDTCQDNTNDSSSWN